MCTLAASTSNRYKPALSPESPLPPWRGTTSVSAQTPSFPHQPYFFLPSGSGSSGTVRRETLCFFLLESLERRLSRFCAASTTLGICGITRLRSRLQIGFGAIIPRSLLTTRKSTLRAATVAAETPSRPFDSSESFFFFSFSLRANARFLLCLSQRPDLI